MSRRVVCAALRNAKGEIVCGARHWDEIMRKQLAQLVTVNENWDNHSGIQQGFIDQFGVFLDRVEALAVAKEANQIIHRCGGDEHQLYSENLY